jgi:hypothetical protein
MRGLGKVVLACWLTAVLAPAPALAQDPEVHTDPDPGSPAGSLYQIPLERGRDDAAPRGGSTGGGTAGGGATGGGGAPAASGIHTENGFGSSSQVPGAPQGAGSGQASAGGESATQGGTAGATSRGRATGAAVREGRATAGLAASQVSVSRALILLGLGVALAVLLGLAGRRAAGRR